MSARTSLLTALALAGIAALDLLVLKSGATLFLMRKLAGLVEYLAFWR